MSDVERSSLFCQNLCNPQQHFILSQWSVSSPLSSPSAAFLSLPTHCHDFLLVFLVSSMLAVKSLLLYVEGKASKMSSDHTLPSLSSFRGFPYTWCPLNPSWPLINTPGSCFVLVASLICLSFPNHSGIASSFQ